MKDVFVNYPLDSDENPFEAKTKGKYFGFLTNREKCYSYLSDDMGPFTHNSEGLCRAMPMGYTNLWILERVLVSSSEEETVVFKEKTEDIKELYCICHNDDKWENYSALAVLNMASEETKKIHEEKKYHLFLKQLKREMGVKKIVMVGATILEDYYWH